jgi:ABC-type glycerol-3-phosphate transport system substrate-binding protein
VPDAFIAYALSNGANYLTPSGTLDLTNAKLKAVFQDYANVVAADRVAPLLPSSGTSSIVQASGRFTSGEVAMFVDGPWDIINIRQSIHFHMGLAPLPAGSAGSISVSAGSGFGIATTSQHKDEAWKAIQVLTSPEAEEYLSDQGRGYAARMAQQRGWYAVAAKDVDNAQSALETALKSAATYRTTTNWNTVNNLFEQYSPLAFGGQQSATKVLTTIQQLAAEQ